MATVHVHSIQITQAFIFRFTKALGNIQELMNREFWKTQTWALFATKR
jgi:hypothetical protein